MILNEGKDFRTGQLEATKNLRVDTSSYRIQDRHSEVEGMNVEKLGLCEQVLDLLCSLHEPDTCTGLRMCKILTCVDDWEVSL